MKRTQACRDELPAGDGFSLVSHPCRRCGHPGVTVVCLGRDERGASSMAWCGPDCARLDGWPGLAFEVSSRRRRRMARTMPSGALH